MADASRSGFRKDIQGLRAIAVGAVVLYHMWPHRMSGGFIGVDVFFVISGYLITSHLVRRPPRNGKEVKEFWLRRVKRLIPASFTVLFISLLGILTLAPVTVWKDWLFQLLAATFYVENWKLAASSTDYLAEDNAASAIQHFWSLSVEEQFYFFWPVFIGVLVAVALANGLKPKLCVGMGIGGVLLFSLAYSIFLTATEPGAAYFSTFTRAWEFSLGALIALLPSSRNTSMGTRWVSTLAWIGVAAILSSALFYDGSLPFPSATALLPVVGTALVIWAASEDRHSPYRLLSCKPAQFVGDHSYSLYLWHWPLIVLVPYAVGRSLYWPDKLLLLFAAIVLSILTKKWIEDGFREVLNKSRFLTAGRFLLVSSLSLGLLSSTGTYVVNQFEEVQAREISTRANTTKAELGYECFGAPSLDHNCPPPDGSIDLVPSPVAVKADKSDAYPDDCWANDYDNFQRRPVCKYGNGERQVALVGNSHAGQWLPALQDFAEKHDWTITTYLASRCAPMKDPQKFESESKSVGCADWGQWVQDQTVDKKFDLVVASSRQSMPMAGYSYAESKDPAHDSYRSYLQVWVDSQIPVVVIRDTPFPGATIENIPDCIAANSRDLSRCSGNEHAWQSMDEQFTAAQSFSRKKVGTINMNDYLCRDADCPAVIGQVITYFDSSHISATYAESLAPMLSERLLGVMSRFE